MKKVIGLLLSASMVISSVIPAFAAVTVDKTEEYNFGDSITITRDSSAAAVVEITSEDGVKVLWDSFKDGETTKTFKIPAEDNELGWTEGTYTVKTGADTTTFEIKAAPTATFVDWNYDSVTIAMGGNITLIATFSENPAGSKVVYESTDNSVAYMSENVVMGVQPGVVAISAKLVDANGVTIAETTSAQALAVTVTSGYGGIGNTGYYGSGNSSGGSLAGGNVSAGATAGVGIQSKPDVNTNVSFSDMNTAAWADTAVTFLAKKGIIAGYEDGSFAPNASITRAEFCKMISNLYGLINETGTFPTQSFMDVPRDAWFFRYVEVCSALGIVNGYGDGNFDPNKTISRQEMAAIIYRTANVMGTTLTATQAEKVFSDAYQIHDYAKVPVKTLQMAGIVSGTSETTFEPLAGSTRAQAATIIYNMYTNYAK